MTELLLPCPCRDFSWPGTSGQGARRAADPAAKETAIRAVPYASRGARAICPCPRPPPPGLPPTHPSSPPGPPERMIRRGQLRVKETGGGAKDTGVEKYTNTHMGTCDTRRQRGRERERERGKRNVRMRELSMERQSPEWRECVCLFVGCLADVCV